MKAGSILLVDDDPLVLESLRLSLQDEGYTVATAGNGREAIALCKRLSYEVVVCDIRMPEINGIDTLRAIKQLQPEVRTIVITGYADDPEAPVQAIRLGVDDYLLKPFEDELLVHSVARNVERFRLEAENECLRRQLEEANARLRLENTRLKRQITGRYKLADIIGTSPAMAGVYRQLEPVIGSHITVLLTGETGTGKELIARAVHFSGPRREGSFVPVHCGALQESLLESELFGVIPNYPGLHSPTGKRGLFDEADGGTLFLDEIGEMSPAMQVKLLRVTQDGEFQRVGDTQCRQVDVRLIAATNRDLDEEVAANRFRKDLYYRLAGVEVHLPPLRQRREDIPLLARHYLDRLCQQSARDKVDLATESLRLLESYSWPGNVRELEKELERALTLCGDGEIRPEDFSERLRGAPSSLPPGLGTSIPLVEVERRHIQGVLRQAGWNIGRAADLLGIHRNTLSRKITEHGLKEG